MDESVMNILRGYSWPGNIRQLRHAVRTMLVMCDHGTIEIRDIPPEIYQVKQIGGKVASSGSEQAGSVFAGWSLSDVEKYHIEKTLRATGGNRAETAKILKIAERTLYRKIKEYDL